MFQGMIASFEANGFITTTITKAKALKDVLQKDQKKVYMVRMGNRKGDNAQMARLVSAEYADKKFGAPKTKEKQTKNTKKK